MLNQDWDFDAVAKVSKNASSMPFINTPFRIRHQMNDNDVLDSSLNYSIVLPTRNSNKHRVAANSSLSQVSSLFQSVVISRAFIAYFLYFLRVISLFSRWFLIVLRLFNILQQRAAKWAQHHYMLNGIRLFVWPPKKMKIVFTSNQVKAHTIFNKCST